MPLAGAIESRDVVPDVMPDDDAIQQVVEEQAHRRRFLHSVDSLVARDAVHGDRRVVIRHLEQDFEGVIEENFTVLHDDGPDGDNPVAAWIEPGSLGVQRNEPNLPRRSIAGPGVRKSRGVAFHAHRSPSSVDSVNSRSLWMDVKAVFSSN